MTNAFADNWLKIHHMQLFLELFVNFHKEVMLSSKHIARRDVDIIIGIIKIFTVAIGTITIAETINVIMI